MSAVLCLVFFFFFQAEDGIRDLVRSRGLGDVYKRQAQHRGHWIGRHSDIAALVVPGSYRLACRAGGVYLSLIHI